VAKSVLRPLTCAGCAGPLLAEETTDLFTCAHCGTVYKDTGARGYLRRHFPVGLGRLEAVGTAAGWLRQAADTPGDIETAVFTEAYLLYVPIWEVGAHVVGWEFGVKWRTRREVVQRGEEQTMELRLVDEASEQGFLGERRMYEEAADLSALGMRRPHVTGRERALPFTPAALPQGAAVLEPDRGYGEVLERARRSFRRPPTGAAARDRHIFVLKESVTLLYYPLWSLRYRYRGRQYDITVDGRNGAVHSARAPADNTRRLALMVGAYALLALTLAAVAAFSSSLPASRQTVLYAGLLTLALGGLVYQRFSLLREVRHSEPFSS
jgi:hypothetical protein